MSNTPALDAEYERVITSKFDTKRDGTPLHCLACGTAVTLGNAYAATKGDGWHTYCGTCAASYAGQIEGLYGRIRTLFTDTPDLQSDEAIAGAIRTATTMVRTLVAEDPQTARTFLATKAALMNARTAIGQARAAVRQAATLSRLQGDPLYEGLTLATTYGSPKDREVAESMLSQWARKGALSERQISYGTSIAERAHKAAAKALSGQDTGVTLDPGLYVWGEHVYRISKLQDRRIARRYDGVTFEPAPGHARKLQDAVEAGQARPMNHTEAHAFGKQHGRCFNCLAIGRPGRLEDDRSVAVGYGPDCADYHGWFYPNAEQAAAILRGEMNIPAPVQS